MINYITMATGKALDSSMLSDYGQLPDYDIDTEREFPDSRPQSGGWIEYS